MATGEIVKPREIVKANNELFRCKYTIKDVVAGRIFMAFASLVDHKDVKENDSFVEYKIAASSIIQDIDAGGDYYNQLRDAAYSLVDQKIEQRTDKKHFAVYTLFSKIAYDDGVIIGQFHKDLMPFFLIAKERFTKMQLSEYMRLPSIYSQCVFSFLKSWSDKNEVIIRLSELHEMLNTPQSLRKNFKDFRIRVLEKAQKDISEKTTLSFEYEAIKEGRAVREIKFKIFKNANPANGGEAELLDGAPPEKPAYLLFEEFLNKFPNPAANRLKAYKEWSRLNESGVAPLADNVPEDIKAMENINLDVMEFLAGWAEGRMGGLADAEPGQKKGGERPE